jgi:hypothetical protein
MQAIRKFLALAVLRILDASYRMNYKEIDKKAFDQWAFRSFDDTGWRSYFAYEDLKILKEMGNGKGPWEYAVLIGRRQQLLFLFDEMKKAVEQRKAKQEIEAAKAKVDNQKP